MLDIRNQVVRLKWSSLGSYLMAIGKLLVAVTTFSIFLALNGLYTAAIGYGKHQSIQGMEDKKGQGWLWYYKRIGLLILLASLLYILYTLRLFVTHQRVAYSKHVAIGIATITFFEMGSSIFGIIRASKKKSVMMKAVKLLNLSSSLIGLVLTQTALLSFTTTKDLAQANVFSGFFFGSITIGIGLWMMIKEPAEMGYTKN